jgi:hypothetical protein
MYITDPSNPHPQGFKLLKAFAVVPLFPLNVKLSASALGSH